MNGLVSIVVLILGGALIANLMANSAVFHSITLAIGRVWNSAMKNAVGP